MPLYANIKGPVGYETIGSPTMNDGIATGFSASDYYKLDTEFRPGCNTWEILTRVKISSFSAKCTFISYAATDTRSFQVGTTTTGAINVYISSNGTSCDIANGTYSTEKLSLDTYYYVLSKFTGTTYEVLVSEDKENWTTFLTVNSSTPVWQGTFFSLGYNFSQYPEPMNGYIDFNESYIKIGDTIFWGKGFSRVKIQTGMVNYSIIGSPTIQDGILSTSTSSVSNRIEFPYLNMDGANKIELIVNYNYIAPSSGNSYLYHSAANATTGRIQLDINSSGLLECYISDDNNTTYVRPYVNGNAFNYSYAKLTIENNSAYCSLSNDGITWINGNSLTITRATRYLLSLGKYMQLSTNTINLNNSYIRINNQYWWKGNIFASKTYTLHILEGDYGFTDGKLVWASPNLYLQNTTNEWIDTGIVADETTQAIINYKIDSSREISSSTRNWICGGSAVYQKLGNFYGGFWQTSSTNIYYWLNTSSTGSGQNAGQTYTDFDSKYKLELNGTVINTKSSITKDGNDTSWTYQNNAGEIDQTANFLLFNRYTNVGSSSTAFLGKIYNCKIYKNNQLIRHLVPVQQGLVIGNYTVPSNGLFDIVTQTFFANQGSGTFIFGKDS